MKKIILETRGREVNITSLEEVETVQDIITELIIPAFQASGFAPETINDGLSDYMDIHMPHVQTPCAKCDDLGGQLFQAQKEIDQYQSHNERLQKQLLKFQSDYEIIYKQNEDYGERIDNHVAKEIEMAEQIVDLQMGQEAIENGNPSYGELIKASVEEEENINPTPEKEEKYQCSYCAEEFILEELDPDHGYCKQCWDKHICPDCQQPYDYCECSYCPNCGEESENGAGEYCDTCYEAENENDGESTEVPVLTGRIRTAAPEPNIVQPVAIPPNVWSTGTAQAGWAVPPNEQTVEPEQEEINAPEEEKIPYPCVRHDDCQNFGTFNCGDVSCKQRAFYYFKPKNHSEDWECPDCEWSNYGKETVCEVCGHKKDQWIRHLVDTDYSLAEVIYEPLNPEPVEPEPQAVSMWVTDDLETEHTPVRQETDMDCISCGTNMEEIGDGEYRCPKCEYETDCMCYDCRKKREGKSEPVEPEEEYYHLTDEQKAENLERCQKQQADVQERHDDGQWHPDEMQGVTRWGCSNAKEKWNVNCEGKGACSECPVGNKRSPTHAMEHGLFVCTSCGRSWEKPFPIGCCPSCGVHPHNRSSSGSSHEFCGQHWDVHRPSDGYEADEDENWKEGRDDAYDD